jgi:hypothetical protein
LAIALLISMIGSAPMWTVVVVLPTVQAEFGTCGRRCNLATVSRSKWATRLPLQHARS